MHVLAAVADLSASECVRQTTRLALEELAGAFGRRRTPCFCRMFWECYVENKLDYKEAWRCSKTQKQALPGAGENMVRLLRCQMVGQEPRSAEEELGWLQGSVWP